MRNLKKILALVLALVMSLSLMATAGATEFPDDDKISDTYRTAAEVLNQLNVFAGDQNGNFNPTDPIRRSEVAAILYRIGTGDVGVEGHKTYAPYNQFKDVQAEDWYAGYVTYCANAGWIKGRSNNDFDPNANVTGYEVLAMILRAVGYDKNNEFVGSNWQLNTASIAREKGVLVNVLKDPSVQLSQPATREVVAELLFRAALLPQVTWNAATLSYVDGGETLGMVNFGLEDVSGVVVANEWANIVDDDAKVLADGTTQLKLADNTLYTVNKSTELEAVGQEYSAYVADSTDGSRTKRALTLEPSGRSVVATNDGKSVNVASLAGTNETHTNSRNDQGFPSIAAMAAGQGISSLGSAPYYLNYSLSYRDWETSDILIRYAVAKVSVDGYRTGDGIYGPDGAELPASSGNGSWSKYIQTLKNDNNKADSAKTYPGHSVEERNIRVNWDANGDASIDANDVLTCYVVAISPEYNAPTSSGAANWIDTEINPTDIAIMRDIFYTADRLGSNTTGAAISETQNYVYGEVYTGTSSLTDESDTLSWPQFTEKYFKRQDTVTYQGCGNGNSLRVIDTDGNGVADYIFKVTYAQDEAIGTYRDALEFYTLAPGSNTVWDGGVESYAVGDVVNYRTIDGKTTIWKAEKVTDVVNDKHFNNITVTLASDGDRGQSDIVNNTGMDDNIMTMNDRVEYNVYLDQFGFIRTFELAQGSNYALVTEIYNTNNQAYNYVNTNNWIAEIKAGSADVEEYTISNARNNPFITNYAWTTRNTRYYNGADLNFMQPAIAHLGAIPGDALRVQFMGATKGQTPEYWQFTGSWNRGIFAMDPVVSALNASGANANSIRANGQTDYGVFNYGAVDYTAEQSYHTSGAGTAGTAAGSFSFTNIAQYTLDGDTVALSTAAKLATDRNGEQLYRVGYNAGNLGVPTVSGSSAPGSGNELTYGLVGTEAELRAAWIADHTQADGRVSDTTYTSASSSAADIKAAVDAWWNNNYSGSTATTITGNVAKDGTKIYPVYLNDYIQLDLNSAVQGATINSTTRHYNISANYNTFYNTNSNTYVNAVADTEFYVVMPDRVLYCESYADLPAIATGTIRAAYAVATNTQANTSGQDYWVADVIVIETTNLVSTYQSVSLMYYNPWINSSSVRYVNSLNNQWRTYEGVEDANVTVVPEYSDGGSYVWGNQSWQTGNTMATSDYGFYALYDTEYANGNLTAYDARKIEGDWNKNHIFAGTIRRLTTASKDPTYSLAASNYMDVDIQGRGANLLNDDQYVIPVGIREVPIYRVTANSANQIRLNQIGGGDVTVNDEIIWVTDMSGNVSYIIDLGARPAYNYTAPAYLINGTNGIYDLVKAEQIKKINDDTIYYDTVTIDVNLAAGETLTISGTGLQNTVTAGSATFAGGTVTTALNINRALPAVDLTLSLRDAAGNYKPIAMVVHIGPVAGAWSIGGLQLNNDVKTYTLRLINGTVRPRSADNLTSAINLIVYSEARIDELITDSAKTIAADPGEGEITLAEAQAVQAELTAISAVLDGRITIEGNPVDTVPVVPSAEDVEDVPAEMTPPANAGEIQGEVDAAADEVGGSVLTESKAQATETVNNSITTEQQAKIDTLTDNQKAVVTTAKTTALAAIESAEDTDTVTSAVTTYTDAVTAAVELADARTAAKTEKTEYMADAIAALSADVTAAQTALDNAMNADNATKTSVENAVTAYHTAVDTALETALDAKLTVVPANLAGGSGENPEGDHADTYTATKTERTIAVIATGLDQTVSDTPGGPAGEHYWIGVGIEKLDGATYKFGWKTEGANADKDSEQTTNTKSYETFYWGSENWPENTKEGVITVTLAGVTVTYTVTFSVTLKAVTP